MLCNVHAAGEVDISMMQAEEPNLVTKYLADAAIPHFQEPQGPAASGFADSLPNLNQRNDTPIGMPAFIMGMCWARLAAIGDTHISMRTVRGLPRTCSRSCATVAVFGTLTR